MPGTAPDSHAPIRPPDGADPEPPEPWGWTRRQRIGLGILLTLLLAFLAIQFVRRPARLNEPAVLTHDPAVVLPRQVDPNIATPQELARLPHIGDTLAQKIVEYRQVRTANSADGIVFRQPGDLDAVPGIGPKLVEQMTPFLKFPAPQQRGRPARRPSLAVSNAPHRSCALSIALAAP